MTINELNNKLNEMRNNKEKLLKGTGAFSLNECIKSVKEHMSYRSLKEQYVSYIERALNDPFFNKTMIIAVEIVEQENA